MKRIEYIVEDSRQIKRVFDIGKYDAPKVIITSPPYFHMKNYENRGCQIGFGQTYEKYLNDVTRVFQDCYEISSRNASFWLVADTFRGSDGSTVPLPFDILKRLSTDSGNRGWILRDVLIWNKIKNVPWNSGRRFKNLFEYILFFAKNRSHQFNIDEVRDISDLKKWWLTYPERYNPKGKGPSNLWEIGTPMRGWGNGCQRHMCPFPFELVERMISISSSEDDLILDPFAGSGSTMAIAKVMKRRAIGVDINAEYRKRFFAEVIPGAERYWKIRTRDRDSLSRKLNDFRVLNEKLRKMKLAIRTIQQLKEASVRGVRPPFIVIDNPAKRDSVSLVILSNSAGREKDLEFDEMTQETLSRLSAEFKVKVSIEMMAVDLIRKKWQGRFFFKYNLDRFHQCIAQSPIDEVTADRDGGVIYANLQLRISKPDDLFKKNLQLLCIQEQGMPKAR